MQHWTMASSETVVALLAVVGLGGGLGLEEMLLLLLLLLEKLVVVVVVVVLVVAVVKVRSPAMTSANMSSKSSSAV
jgi:hypothetical protein